MTRHVISDSASTYTRISKREARKRWLTEESFYIIAHKMRPGFPFSMGMTIDPKHIKAERSLTPTYPTVDSLFDATIIEFCYYNANCHETGLYPAFYTVTKRKRSKLA